jgi:hypothetical protein
MDIMDMGTDTAITTIITNDRLEKLKRKLKLQPVQTLEAMETLKPKPKQRPKQK